MLNLLCLIAIIPLWITGVQILGEFLPDSVADIIGVFLGPALYVAYALWLNPILPTW